MKSTIFLIGFMGTGKSTIACALSKAMTYTQVEMDEQIAREEKKSIPEIFKECGESYFRDCETALLKNLAAEGNARTVVSCGGGVVLRPENVELMRKCGIIVLLTATSETIYKRVRKNDDRPLLQEQMNVAHIRELLAERQACYEAAADCVVATDGRSVEEICQEILQKI